METNNQGPDVICLSHLAWETTLFQRPQQIMRQLSGRRRVLYVAFADTRLFLRAMRRGDWKVCAGRPNERLTYLNLPYLPLTKYFPVLRSVLCALVVYAARFLAWRRGFRRPDLWLYYPGFFPFVRKIPRGKLVYDCMDQFTAFSTRQPKVEKWEAALIENADAVFTGGASLQKAKEGANPRTFCFPSGVDFDHFNQAAQTETPVADDIRDIPKPILGYFGAVDERIDFELVDRICRERPDWSVVFVGPSLVGELPPSGRANFHHLGKKDYALLPRYLKAFDVCLMPFVNSDLTRHISPTKTPEYLAGGKPVVSTPVPDVVADYGDEVRFAKDGDEFLKEIEAALQNQDAGLAERLRKKARAKSWESIALEMEELANRR